MHIRCISYYLAYIYPGRGDIFSARPNGKSGTFRRLAEPTAHGGHGAAFTLTRCRVGPQALGEARLTVRAEAADQESLRRIQDLLTSRLQKFGRREHLTVNWQDLGTSAAEAGTTVRSEDIRAERAGHSR